MRNIFFILILLFLSACSWISPDYWKVRSIVTEYQKNLYALDFKRAGNYLTNNSRNVVLEKLNKDYSKKELLNYKKLSSFSSFKFDNIVVNGNVAEVIINESVPDFEMIFGTIISWHVNKEKDGGAAIPLETLIDKFIDEIVSAEPELFLIQQETSYQLVKEKDNWFLKLD